MKDLCYRKDTCKNHPKMCGMCAVSSDIQNHYPLFKNKDEVEVVRCKDRKNRYTEGCPFMFWDCGEFMGETDDNDFCSYGERKEK